MKKISKMNDKEKKAALLKAANDIKDLEAFEQFPEISKLSTAKLEAVVKEFGKALQAEEIEELEEDTVEIMTQLGVVVAEEGTETEEEPEETEDDEPATMEAEAAEETEEIDVEEIKEEIEDAEDISELRDIAKENPVIFKQLNFRIKSYKKVEVLAAEMIRILEAGGEKPAKEEKKTKAPAKAKEKAPKKGTKKEVEKSEPVADPYAELRAELEEEDDVEELKEICCENEVFAEITEKRKGKYLAKFDDADELREKMLELIPVPTEEVEEELTLAEQVEELSAADDLDGLKELCKSEEAFAEIAEKRKGKYLATFGFTEDLKKKMLEVLGVSPSKKVSAAKPKSAGKKKSGGMGVIATIASLIENSGKAGISKEDILASLVKSFPDREESSMAKTIQAQLPKRMSKERFEIKVVKDGKFAKA